MQVTKTIYKYPLKSSTGEIVMMPKESKILCVQLQENIPTLWALVSPQNSPEPRQIEVYATGGDILFEAEENGLLLLTRKKYIGTFQLRNGRLVYHVFENITH